MSGGAVALAWFIGFIIYFYKRHRREKRARALGFRGHREMLDPPKKPEAFIIPPDPAIVEAGLHPGERIYDDPKVTGSGMPKHAHTLPLGEKEKASDTMVAGSPPRAEVKHSASEPSVLDHEHFEHSPSPTGAGRPARPTKVSTEMIVPRHV